ncbi:MAG: chemotaxis protein CheB [Desulfatibacillaceae bacterium]|nr:chemotaxis protein CheB [Desulfatibacillaceae bacterium]
MARKANILLVDDSKLFRQVLRKIVESEPGFTVADEAIDGRQAIERITRQRPDMVLLDVNMPVMGGLTALKHIMVKSPCPTVMVSTLTRPGARVTFQALQCGAVDFIEKPQNLRGISLAAQKGEILRKLRMACSVRVERLRYFRGPKPENGSAKIGGPPMFVAGLGASEGGYSSLLRIIPALSPDIPAAFVAVLHEEPQYVSSFADFLNEASPLGVKMAQNGDILQQGMVYLVPGKNYASLGKSSQGDFLFVEPNPFPDRRGAFNMLLFSLAEAMGEKALGIVLSGAGEDGAEGMGEIIRHGGRAVVEDPATCLFEEMPKAALEQKGVSLVLPARQIASQINNSLGR